MALVAATLYTDPGCPWAFSAEPQRLALRWHYGDQIDVQPVMIVLARSGQEYLDRGYAPEKVAPIHGRIQRMYGMPISTAQRERMAGTLLACRAVRGAELRAGDVAAELLLRALRVRTMAGGLLDEPATIEQAAEDAGLEPEYVLAWTDEPEVVELTDRDAELARAPSEAALALAHKLTNVGGSLRYSAPSWVFTSHDVTIEAPGFQPLESLEVAVANVAPTIERRAASKDPVELLEWAPYPLATAEVAALLGTDIDDARNRLADTGAAFEPVGADGYWSR